MDYFHHTKKIGKDSPITKRKKRQLDKHKKRKAAIGLPIAAFLLFVATSLSGMA
jgi:hypothetical protein